MGETKINISTLADLETDWSGNGTVIIQRRDDYGGHRENFDRSWAQYKHGFGDRNKEFWLGNEQIHQLTKSGDKKLRVELGSDDGKTEWAEYDTFIVEGEAQGYLLNVSGYSGTAGDCLRVHNGFKFSTRNNNKLPRVFYNCAQYFQAGWWFSR